MRRDEGPQPHVGPRGLPGRQGLYLRTDPVLLLQLRQHSRVIGSGVGEEWRVLRKGRKRLGERTNRIAAVIVGHPMWGILKG